MQCNSQVVSIGQTSNQVIERNSELFWLECQCRGADTFGVISNRPSVIGDENRSLEGRDGHRPAPLRPAVGHRRADYPSHMRRQLPTHSPCWSCRRRRRRSTPTDRCGRSGIRYRFAIAVSRAPTRDDGIVHEKFVRSDNDRFASCRRLSMRLSDVAAWMSKGVLITFSSR